MIFVKVITIMQKANLTPVSLFVFKPRIPPLTRHLFCINIGVQMYPIHQKGLTKRQESVLVFLREFISVRGYAPSLREICAKFGIKSPKNAKKHLEALEKKGF
ncbi:hypothetical protein EPN18_06915, partial [bacterium]